MTGGIEMTFERIDMEQWPRREHYRYYNEQIRTSYEMNVELDVTKLRKRCLKKGIHFYPAIMNLMVTSENNNRKIHLPRSRCVMSHRCKRNPRYTGYRRKGIRTIRLGFNSFAILILLHISADIFVKYAEILIPFCPDI